MNRRSLFGLLTAPAVLTLLPEVGAAPVPVSTLPWYFRPVEIKWFGRPTGYNPLYFPPQEVAEEALRIIQRRESRATLRWDRLIGWPPDSPQMAYIQFPDSRSLLVGAMLDSRGRPIYY